MAANATSSGDFETIKMASDIVASYLRNNKVDANQIPVLLQDVYSSVSGLGSGNAFPLQRREPAVPKEKSVTPNHIICLEDGKKLKMLKRYLRTHFDMSPEEYRRKWGLPADYPMTAPNYAKQRSQLAKDFGLGTAAVSKRRGVKSKKSVAKRKSRPAKKKAA